MKVSHATMKNCLFKNAMSYFATEYYGIYKIEIKLQLYLVGTVVKNLLGSGRSPGERNGNPLQHSCLENSMGRGAWQATVHGVAKSQI